MIADALEGDGRIGMVLLKPGWENDYHGHPDIASVGCVGKIEKHSKMPEGKYNIVLFGLHRFRVLKEIEGKLYRRAQVELLEEINDCNLPSEPLPVRDRVIEYLEQYLESIPNGEKEKQELDLETCSTLGRLADRIAYHFDLSMEEKQAFLEEQDVIKRVDIVHSVIDLKMRLIRLSRKFKDSGIDLRMN